MKNVIKFRRTLGLIATIVLMFSSTRFLLVAAAPLESLGTQVVAWQKKISPLGFQPSTLQVGYTISSSHDNGVSWHLVERNRLVWDVRNGKYRFFSTSPNRNKKEKVKTRDYSYEDGKWTILFADYTNHGDLHPVGNALTSNVTICKAYESPFYYPFTYFSMSNGKYFDAVLSDKNVKIKESAEEVTFILDLPTNNDEVRERSTFSFNKSTGLFQRKLVDTVDLKGNLIKKKVELSVQNGEYYNIGGKYFPKKMYYKNYYRSQDTRDITLFSFDSDVKIDSPIPPEALKLSIPLGVEVLDDLNKKSYINGEGNNSAEEKAMVRRLDEIFENATKKK